MISPSPQTSPLAIAALVRLSRHDGGPDDTVLWRKRAASSSELPGAGGGAGGRYFRVKRRYATATEAATTKGKYSGA
jgi:hypothetical protein